VIDGNMVFDYTLRQGPSPTTNALKIMELAGLPVGEDFTAENAEERREERAE
jgi:DNA mismatch repair ATPase MutS